MILKRIILFFALFALSKSTFSQLELEQPLNTENILIEQTLSFEEYLVFVKQQHPLMKQANLRLSSGEANLLKARGGFDPKIEVDFNRKKFKGIEYYDQLNTTFKVPTWYGIEFKGNFEENTGDFLNPNLSVPVGGLYSAGVSFSLAQGLLINDRMAMLKKARFFKEQTKAERDLLINDLLFEASKAYFEWLEATNEEKIYRNFLKNAGDRFKGIKRSIETGDKAAIDSIESKITLVNRELNLEAAKLKRRKAALKVSNYLWLNDFPVELQENVVPELPDDAILESSLSLQSIANNNFVNNHPKLKALDYNIKGLTVDRSLKKNKLLPKIDLEYNFLSTNYDQINSFNTTNYKAFVNFSFPLFLRKERGDLKLAKIKVQDANFDRMSTSVSIQNKIEAINAEIISLNKQNNLIISIVKDYTTLVKAEIRKFSLGESSLFLINSREKSLIDAQLKGNTLNIKRLTSSASLFNALGIVPLETMN
jgi:outer membrane protein TolC